MSRSLPDSDTRVRAEWTKLTSKNPILRVVGVLIFLVAVVLVCRPTAPETVEPISAVAIGSVAQETLVSGHEFTWQNLDEDSYAQLRQEAVDSVLPVWDYHADDKELIVDRIDRTFISMRRNLRNAAIERWDRMVEATQLAMPPDMDGSGSGVAPPAPEPPEPPANILDVLPEQERVRIATSEESIGEFVRQMQHAVDVSTIEALAIDGFSETSQSALRTLVAMTMEHAIVDDMTVLVAQAGDGVTLRSMRAESAFLEQTMTDYDDFLDVETAREFVDREATISLASIDDRDLADGLADLARVLIDTNTQFSDRETSRRRTAAVETAMVESSQRSFVAGEVVLRAGQVITAEHIAIVERMAATQPMPPPPWLMMLGLVFVVLLTVLPALRYGHHQLPAFGRTTRDTAMMATALVLHLAVIRLGITIMDSVSSTGDLGLAAGTLYIMLPFALGPMIVRILTRTENALIFAVVAAVLTGTLFDAQLKYIICALVAALVAVPLVGNAEKRMDVFGAGLAAGATLGLAGAAVSLFAGEPPSIQLLWTLLLGAGSGVMSALLVNALIPFFEAVFRYTTPMTLLELANLNHPALRDLILQAPGTYHHSMMVGQLVEAACEAVGANALLGRVGAYYHDIGKMKNPMYFAENQQGTNPHSKLKPNMSALIIKAHVKDGAEMAKQHKLPEELIDFIREHHGTSLIRFFYRRAQEETEGEVRESDYRYPGPKPQTRETAICLLADGIEAASRAMPEPTPARIQGLVNKMINVAFTDGQLEKCDLTLKDLNMIAKAFIHRLTAFYHHRPEYPDAKKSDPKKGDKKTETPKGTQRKKRGSREISSVDDPDSIESGGVPQADEPPNSEVDGGDGVDDQGDGDDADERPEGTTEHSGVHLRRLGL